MTRRPTILDSIDAMRAETRDAARGLLDRAEAEGRDLTDLERREYEKHMSDLEGLNERYEDLKAEVERRQNAERTAAEFNGNTSTRTAPQTSTAPPSQTAPLVRVGGEPTVYETREHSYVRDLVARAVHQDADATGRLAQHATQVRAMSTDVATAGAEFVPPAYLVQDYAEKARSLRSAANLVTVLGLPGGVDAVNIPRVTTGGKVAPQASQNASVTTQDLVTTETSADLVTIAGYVDVSVQYLEQSPDAARAEDVVFTDLLGALEEETERQVIEGSGASGELLGLLTLGGTGSVSYTDTSPTAGELYPKVAESINDVVTGRHRAPEAIVMHPRRWLWLASQRDSDGRPFVTPSANVNAMATMSGFAEGGPAGAMFGLPVHLSTQIPTDLGDGTNEDRIVVARYSDCRLWESPVRMRVFPSVGSGTLTVRLELWRYSIFIPGRYPAAISVIDGTGLSEPTFS